MSEALNVLKELLEDYGIENAEEIISEAKDITQSYNPLKNTGYKISAEDWLNKRGFDSKLNTNYSQYLVFEPKYDQNNNLLSFQLYNGVKQKDTFRYLDKLNSFDVNSYNNVIRKDNFKKSIDAGFIKENINYGISFDSHKTSYTIGNIIDKQFISEDVIRNNIFKFNNPANIEYAKNKILKENTEITKIKNFESFRTLTNINEVQTILPEKGILTNSLLAKNNYSFYDSLFKDTTMPDKYKEELLNDLKDIKGNKNNFVRKHFEEYFKRFTTSQIFPLHLNVSEEELNNELKNFITYDKEYLSSFKMDFKDMNKAKEALLEDMGLNKFIKEEANKLSFSIINNVNKTQEYNINLKAYEFFKNQQKQETISGDYLNKKYGVLSFNKDKKYSIQELQEISFENQNPKIIKDFKNEFRIKNDKVLFDFVDFKQNRIIKNTLNLGISKNEFERYLHLDYRAKGDVLLDSLIKSKLSTNEIVNTLQSINDDIKDIQLGKTINYNDIQKKYNNLNKDQIKYINNAISEGNQLFINNIINRSQTMIQGNSNKVNHSIQGSLSAFNKLGARPWQSLESLNDVIIKLDSSEKSGTKYYNLNKIVSDFKSKKYNYIAKPNEIVNKNLKELGKAEAIFNNNINDFSLRDSNKALFFDSYGIIENGKLKHGQIAYNESMYINKMFARSVFGSNNRNVSIPLDKINNLLNGTFTVDDKNELLNSLKKYTGQKDFEIKTMIFNSMKEDSNKSFTLEQKTKILDKIESMGLKRKDYNRYLRTNDGSSWKYDVSLIEEEFTNLNKMKFKSIGNFNFDSIYLLNDLNIDKDTGMVNINFNDISSIKTGTKVHMNDGFKGTISGIMNTIKVNNMEVAGLNSSKSFNRSFDGSSLYSTIETSLFLSNRQGDINQTKNYIESLKHLKYNNKEFNLFETLNLDFDFNDKTKSFTIFDKNSGINNYLDDLTNNDLINNPHLKSKIETSKTINKLKDLGITNFHQLDLLVNEQYEKYYPKGQKIYSDFDVEINGQTYKMLGKLNLKNLSITGANQVTPLKDALKLDMMTSRFFDTKGFNEIGENIRSQINENYFNTINQFTPQINNNSIRIFEGLNPIKDKMDKYQINFNTDELIKNKNLIHSILYEDLPFESLINLNIKDGKNKNMFDLLNNYLDDLNTSENRPFLIYKYSGKSYSKTLNQLSKTFHQDLDLITDKKLSSEIKDYYDNIKSAIVNKDVDLIKTMQQSNLSIIKDLNEYKSKNSGAHFVNRVITEMNSTNNLEELSKMINVIENPNKAINYNMFYNGVFKDPSTNKVNYGQVKSILRNAMELDSISVHSNISNIFKLDGFETINLRKNKDFLNSIERIKNNKLNNFTSSDIKFYELLNKIINNKDDLSVQNYFNLINKNSINGDIDKKEINKMNYIVQETINDTIKKFESYNSVKINNKNIVNDFNRNIDLHKASIFTKMFGTDKFLKENLTKKKTLITKNLSINLKNSISQQVAESSNILKYISNNILKTDISKPFSDSIIYNDISDLFGEEFTNDVIFKGYKKGTIIDKTKLTNFSKQIEELESVTFVNMNKLKQVSSDVYYNMNSKLENKKGFFGFLARTPLQSPENIVPTYNINIDFNNKQNSIIKELKNNGFDSGSIFNIVGKGTASRMKADNDGDKLYLAIMDELQNNKNQDDLIKASIYYSNSVPNEIIQEKFNDKLTKKQRKWFKKYYNYYNQINKMRTQENIDSHYNIAQEIFTNKKLRDEYLKLGNDKEQNLKTLKYISENLKTKERDFDSTFKLVSKFIGVNDDYSLKDKLKNPFEFLNMTEDYFKDTNIAKTGIVYTKLNQVRNINDILTKLNISDNTIDSFARAVSNGNDKEYNLIKENINDYFKNKNININTLKKYISSINTNNLKSSMLTFEAIELGVISGKHGTRTIFEELEKLTENINSNKKSEMINKFNTLKKISKNGENDKFKRMLIDILDNENINDIDNNVMNILKTSLSSKMYQLNNFVDVLEENNIEKTKKFINNLNSSDIKKIGIATGMISEYSDNIININNMHEFFNQSMKGTKVYRDNYGQFKNNPLAYLTKLLGIDINRITLLGKDVNFNENLNDLTENLLNHYSIDTEQMLSDNDILNLNKIKSNNKRIDNTKNVFNPVEEQLENIYPEENLISKNAQKKAKRIIKQEQRKRIKINNIEQKANKATEEASEKINKFKFTKTKIGIGALLLGAFLGYTTGTSDYSTTQEKSKDEELGLGKNLTSYDRDENNNLGY